MKDQPDSGSNSQSGDPPPSPADIMVRRLKNQPFVAALIVVGVAVTGIATFTDALTRITEFIGKYAPLSSSAPHIYVGTVYTDEGLPLPEVQVLVVDENNKPTSPTARTDSNGKFVVKAAPKTSVFFLVEMERCKSRTFPVPGDSTQHAKLLFHCNR